MSRWQTIRRGGVIPATPGCYVVYVGGDICYIGSSQNLRQRLKRYWIKRRLKYRRVRSRLLQPTGLAWTPWGPHSVESIVIKVKVSRRRGDWLMWEHRLIARLQPFFNRAGTIDE